MSELVQQSFRQTFQFSKELLRWYPGHMNAGMNVMQRKLKSVDCVVEVHDARIAISGRNPNFVKKMLGVKPHILVLNKSDLITQDDEKNILATYKSEGVENIFFTNCKKHNSCRNLSKLVPYAVDLIMNSPRYNRSEQRDLCMMIIGIPNVGKSSLINALRMKNLNRSKATHVGPLAGVTRSVLTKIKVHVNPTMFLIDTPGILPPNIINNEVGLKLALCACVKDNIVSFPVLADFLLFMLNKLGNFSYVDLYDLHQPQNEITPVLAKIAYDYNLYEMKLDVQTHSKVKVPNLDKAAYMMVNAFRTGKFGEINLDKEFLIGNSTVR